MKKPSVFLAFLLSICFTLSINADVIILKDGSSITAYNIEKGADSIFYALSSDVDSPLKKFPVSEVFALKIGNDDLQLLHVTTPDTPVTSHTSSNPPAHGVAPEATTDNATLIQKYNEVTYTHKEKEKNKPAKDAIAAWGVTPNSVLSNAEVEIRFETGIWWDGKWIPTTQLAKKKNMSWVNNLQNKIIICNKTQAPLYVDLSQTIRNSPTIGYRQFYDGSVTTHGSTQCTSVGIGLGIIGIGSTSGNSQTLAEGNPSILVIFPESEIELPRESFVSEYDKQIYERYELYSYVKGPVGFASKIEALNQYQSISYDHKDSPEKINYSLAYATTPDFSTVNRINFSLYIRQLIGIPKYWNVWSGKLEDNLNSLYPLSDTSILSTLRIRE